MKKPPKSVVEGVPIAGFTGVNGAGKTLLAVESCLADLAAGRDVYSTVPIHSKWGDSKPIQSLRQLLTLKHSTILLDEVSVIFSSRSTHSLPAEIVALLQTLRHSDLTVRWTAPGWMRADTILREVTQALVAVTPLLRKHDGTPWPRPRLIYAAVLDTSVGKADSEPERTLRRRLYRTAGLDAFGAFDTHADTPLLGRHLHTGVCVDCGGTINRPKHDEARHIELGLPWFGDQVQDTLAQLREEASEGTPVAHT